MLFRLICMAALLCSALSAGAYAQADYPNRPIRLVIPFGAGGIADIQARIVSAELGKRLGQQVIVDNQPAGFGIPAARAVLTAAPDGYTLALFANGTATSVSLVKDLGFDPVKDFVPVSNVIYFDFLIAVNAESPYRTLADLIGAVRERPGRLNFGATAPGGSSNLAAELVKSTANIQVTVVPYRNPAELPVALLRNDVDMVLDTYALLKPTIDDGKARGLASTGAKRSPVTPNIPTAQESGLAGFEVTSWQGVFVKAGTPAAIIERLNRELRIVLAEPSVKERLLTVGLEAHAGTPEELGARLKSDIDKWAKVIAAAGIEKR
jgi:tripartite-type tricarboxylate transporter receptor subunit TctC